LAFVARKIRLHRLLVQRVVCLGRPLRLLDALRLRQGRLELVRRAVPPRELLLQRVGELALGPPREVVRVLLVVIRGERSRLRDPVRLVVVVVLPERREVIAAHRRGRGRPRGGLPRKAQVLGAGHREPGGKRPLRERASRTRETARAVQMRARVRPRDVARARERHRRERQRQRQRGPRTRTAHGRPFATPSHDRVRVTEAARRCATPFSFFCQVGVGEASGLPHMRPREA
jgi:hypothetical protein